jgi:hypothetical protein
LAISILTLILVLRRPAPIAAPAVSASAAKAQSFQEKLNQLEEPRVGGDGPREVRISADEVNSAIAQAAGTLPAATNSGDAPNPAGRPAEAPSSTNPLEFPGPVPSVKDYQVAIDGDVVRGQFLTEIAGKDVYLTLAGHLGAKDGYATFDATEVKVGDLSIPASLINEVLQKKLAEQRDQLKLPASVKNLKVENGELVLEEK